MIVTLDPTDRDIVTFVISRDGESHSLSWTHRSDAAGARLITELDTLALTAADTLRVVIGPGHFTGVRVAALVGNALRATIGVQLFQKIVDEEVWHAVTSLVPFYAAPPSITPARA